VKPVNEKIETPDKQNAEFLAGYRFRMKDTDPDYPAMVLANYMFGGGLGSRAFDRIRNKEGLSYGVSSFFSAPDEGDQASFGLTASANPQNTPKVEASFKDLLAKTIADGFTEAEVTAARKALHDERAVGRSQDGQLIRVIAIRDEQGRTLKWDEDMDRKLDALSVAEVNAAMKKHIDPSAITIVKAGDFKAAGVYQ
jgi:zinc protease